METQSGISETFQLKWLNPLCFRGIFACRKCVQNLLLIQAVKRSTWKFLRACYSWSPMSSLSPLCYQRTNEPIVCQLTAKTACHTLTSFSQPALPVTWLLSDHDLVMFLNVSFTLSHAPIRFVGFVMQLVMIDFFGRYWVRTGCSRAQEDMYKPYNIVIQKHHSCFYQVYLYVLQGCTHTLLNHTPYSITLQYIFFILQSEGHYQTVTFKLQLRLPSPP